MYIHDISAHCHDSPSTVARWADMQSRSMDTNTQSSEMKMNSESD